MVDPAPGSQITYLLETRKEPVQNEKMGQLCQRPDRETVEELEERV